MPRFISRGSATPVDDFDFKESRMKFADPIKPDRKSGGTAVAQGGVFSQKEKRRRAFVR
jgi:hypothetical protein